MPVARFAYTGEVETLPSGLSEDERYGHAACEQTQTPDRDRHPQSKKICVLHVGWVAELAEGSSPY